MCLFNVGFDDDYYDDNSMDLSGGDAGDDAGGDFLTAIFRFFGFLKNVCYCYNMPSKQVGRGLTKEKREQSKRRTARRTELRKERKKSSDKRKQELLKQGFQLKNRIFLDRGNYGILKQLKLNTYYKVSKYFISGHGSPMDIILKFLTTL